MIRMQFFYVILIWSMASACTSAKITSSWSAPDSVPIPLKKVMVVGIMHQTGQAIKAQLEAHMIGDLKALGYDAVSAYQEYGPKAFENMDEKAVLEKLKNSGVDAVVTIVLLNKQRERMYRPAAIIESPYAVHYNRFWGYYSTLSDRIYAPGYYETSTKYFWESNMYCLCDKALLYSAQTQSFDPQSDAALGHEYGKRIVKDMLRKKVLRNQYPASNQ